MDLEKMISTLWTPFVNSLNVIYPNDARALTSVFLRTYGQGNPVQLAKEGDVTQLHDLLVENRDKFKEEKRVLDVIDKMIHELAPLRRPTIQEQIDEMRAAMIKAGLMEAPATPMEEVKPKRGRRKKVAADV